MHELSIAADLVENVLDFVATHQVSQVLRVRLTVGEMTCVQSEQLRFCYKSITQETTLQGSELEIEPVAAEIKCGHCSYQGPPKYWEEALALTPIPTLICPNCGKQADLQRGQECAIRGIQYVS